MKMIPVTSACLIAALTMVEALPGQTSQAKLIEARSAKLAKPVFKKADWVFDYDQARARAKEEGKLLFTYFTRSYSY
ncbi:MAG: hypothetical protein ACYTG5_18485 [Planctomycetota bacterium]